MSESETTSDWIEKWEEMAKPESEARAVAWKVTPLTSWFLSSSNSTL